MSVRRRTIVPFLIFAVLLGIIAPATFSRATNLAIAAQDSASCTPGATKKIAFMLKQQTAYRYLHADIPFFQKTAEAAGYEVMVQSAETMRRRRSPRRKYDRPGRGRHRDPARSISMSPPQSPRRRANRDTARIL